MQGNCRAQTLKAMHQSTATSENVSSPSLATSCNKSNAFYVMLVFVCILSPEFRNKDFKIRNLKLTWQSLQVVAVARVSRTSSTGMLARSAICAEFENSVTLASTLS